MKKIFFLAICLVAALNAAAQNSFYINNFDISGGETKTLEIMLDNTVALTAIQADLYFPEGLNVEQEDGDYLFDLTDRKGRNHTISSTMLSSGAIRILISSQTLKEFSGNSGALVTFNVIADPTFSGKHEILMKNILASEADQTEHTLPDVTCVINENSAGGDVPTENRFYINDFDINAGETKGLEIMLDNTVALTAIQADLYFPEGLNVEQEDGDYLFDLTDRKGRNHTISSTMLSSGAIRILISSQTLKEFSGNSGALVTFNVIADPTFSGKHEILMKNILASEADQTEHTLPDVTCVINGGGDNPGPGPVTVTSLATTSCEIPQGIKVKFNVGISPSNAENQTLAWSTSDPSIATVAADGTIETLEMGTVTITATTTDGSNIAVNYVINVTESQSQPAGNSLDVNGDGYVTGSDVTMIFNYILGL